MTVVATTDNHPDRRRFQFLDDYCPRCNPAGHYADRRVRLATLTEPTSLIWHGGKRVICRYECHRCGHQWRRADLWTAKEAGFDTKHQKHQRRAA